VTTYQHLFWISEGLNVLFLVVIAGFCYLVHKQRVLIENLLDAVDELFTRWRRRETDQADWWKLH
jgi:hypothetical protein